MLLLLLLVVDEFAAFAALPALPCSCSPRTQPLVTHPRRSADPENKSPDKRVGCMRLCTSVFTLQTDGVKLYRAPELFPSDSY